MSPSNVSGMLSKNLAARGSTGDRTVTWHSTSTRGRHTTTRGTILAGGTILARGTIGASIVAGREFFFSSASSRDLTARLNRHMLMPPLRETNTIWYKIYYEGFRERGAY